MLEFIKSNPFLFAVIILQFGACGYYVMNGQPWFGVLNGGYGALNIIIMGMARGWQ